MTSFDLLEILLPQQNTNRSSSTSFIVMSQNASHRKTVHVQTRVDLICADPWFGGVEKAKKSIVDPKKFFSSALLTVASLRERGCDRSVALVVAQATVIAANAPAAPKKTDRRSWCDCREPGRPSHRGGEGKARLERRPGVFSSGERVKAMGVWESEKAPKASSPTAVGLDLTEDGQRPDEEQ